MIYLYIKQHSLTGLKYFGMTRVKSPYVYMGSGKKWLQHIKKHGKHIITLDVFGFDHQEDATSFALNFSKQNDIVESADWANLMDEDAKGIVFNEHIKSKISNKIKELYAIPENTPMFGRTHSEISKSRMKASSQKRQLTRPKSEIDKFSKCNLGKTHNLDHISKRTAGYKGRFRIVNSDGVVGYAKTYTDPRLLSGEFVKA